MRLSNETLVILRNFAQYNNNLVVEKGSEIGTCSRYKSSFLVTDVTEVFEKPFALHDLSGFLNVLALFDDPELNFGDNSVIISDATSSQEYYYSERENLIYPPKLIRKLGETKFSFDLPNETLDKVLKASSVNDTEHVFFEQDGQNVYLSTYKMDFNNPTDTPKRKFKTWIADAQTAETFRVVISNSKKSKDCIRALPLDYKVEVCLANLRGSEMITVRLKGDLGKNTYMLTMSGIAGTEIKLK